MGSQIHSVDAVLDNGTFGKRTITFETGQFARQAAGSAVAYLGDTMLLSATTASKRPKDQFDPAYKWDAYDAVVDAAARALLEAP